MGLETADTIAELNPLWPLGTDPKSEGDDHIRLIKQVMQDDALSREIFQGGRNTCVNGNAAVWQERTVLPALSTNDFLAEMWAYTQAGGAVIDGARVSMGAQALSLYGIQLDVDTPSAIADGDIYVLEHLTEGNDATRYGFGFADPPDIVVSFKVRSSLPGIYCAAIRNQSSNRTYVVEYEIFQANILEKKQFTLKADDQGTWERELLLGFRINFCVGAGVNFQTGTPDVWTTGAFRATANPVVWAATAAAQFIITELQIELGVVPSNFEFEAISDTIEKCERYFAKTFAFGVVPAQNTGQQGSLMVTAATTLGSRLVLRWDFSSRMRATPTIVTYNPFAANAEVRDLDAAADIGVSVNGVSLSDRATIIHATGTPVDGSRCVVHATADARLL